MKLKKKAVLQVLQFTDDNSSGISVGYFNFFSLQVHIWCQREKLTITSSDMPGLKAVIFKSNLAGESFICSLRRGITCI